LIDDAAHRGALPDDAAQAKEAGGIAARAQVLDAAIGILGVEGGEGQSIAVRRSIRRRSPNGSLHVASFRVSRYCAAAPTRPARWWHPHRRRGGRNRTD